MEARTGRRAFRALARIDAKDVIRDPQIGVSMLTMAAILLVLHTCMWLSFSVAGEEPRVEFGGGVRAELASELSTGLTVVPDDAQSETQSASQPNTIIEETPEGVLVSLLESRVASDPLWQALRDAGVPAQEISIVGRDGYLQPDFLRMNLGTALLAGVGAVAFLGTTVPIVAARGRGLLHMLGTTPLARWLFLASKLPARIALVALCSAVIIAIALVRSYAEPEALPRLLVTILCGTVFLFGPAMLFATRARNAAASQQAMVAVTMGLMFTSGAVLPVAILPEPLRIASGLLPGSWLTEPASADLAGLDPLLPVPVYWLLMLATGIACFVFAARRFQWGEERTAS